MTKKILKILASILLSLLVVLAIAPTVLSTSRVKDFFIEKLNTRIPGKVTVANFAAGWTSGLLIENLEIKDPAGRVVVACDTIKLSDSLFTLLYSPKNFGHLTIQKPILNLFRARDGSFSIAGAFGIPSQPSQAKEGSSPFIPYFTEALVKQGAMALYKQEESGATIEESSIKDFSLQLNLQGLETATFLMTAEIESASNGAALAKNGTISVQAKASNLRALKKSYDAIFLLDSERKPQQVTSEVTATCTLKQFPIAIAESFLAIGNPAYNGLLQEALGETLDCTITHSLFQKNFTLNTALQSPTFSTKFSLIAKDGALESSSPAEFRWEITPAAYKKIQGLNPALQPFELLQATTLEATLQPLKVELPLFQINDKGLTSVSPLPIGLSFGMRAPALFRFRENDLQTSVIGTISAASLLEKVAMKVRFSQALGGSVAMIEADGEVQAPLQENAAAKVVVGLHGAWSGLLDRLKLTKELESIIGKELHGRIELHIPELFHKTPEIALSSQLTTEVITYSGIGSLKGSHLSIGPLSFAYDVLPTHFQRFGKIALTNPFRAKVTLDYLHADLTKKDLQHLDFKGQFTSDPFELTNVPQVNRLQVKQMKAAFEQAVNEDIQMKQELLLQLPALKEPLKLQGSTSLGTSSLKGVLEVTNILPQIAEAPIGNFSLKLPYKLDYTKNKLLCDIEFSEQITPLLKGSVSASINSPESSPVIDSKGKFQTLPTGIFEAFFPKEGKSVRELFGTEISGNWDVNFYGLQARKNKFVGELSGKDLELQLALQIDEKKIGSISGKTPFALKIALTQARAGVLFKAANLEHLKLNEVTPFEFQLTQFELPLSLFERGTSLAGMLDQIELKAALHLGSTSLASNRNSMSYKLPALDGALALQAGSRALTFDLESGKNDLATEIKLQTVLKNLWNERNFTPALSTIEVQSKIKNLPVDCLQLFMLPSTREKVSALVGNSFDATLDSRLSGLTEGKLNASIDGEQIHSNIACAIHEGIITLPAPLHIKAMITKDAGKTLFADVNPLLATSISTPHAVEVVIDNRDFRIPIKVLLQEGGTKEQLKRAIYVPLMTLQIGKIRVQKGNTISTVFSLLGLPEHPESELWLTPIYISMQNGVITLKRSDTLVDKQLQIASWGTVDLLNDRVDLVIGIPGASLRTALGLRTLDPNYMLQIPIRGTTASASLDKTRAVAKIASLRMRESSSDTQALIGGVLGLMTTASEPEAPVPAPTTVPFPWNK